MNSEKRARRDHRAEGDQRADDRLALHPHLDRRRRRSSCSLVRPTADRSISGETLAMTKQMSAATVSASGRSRGPGGRLASTWPHRTQRAFVPRGSGGILCRRSQSGQASGESTRGSLMRRALRQVWRAVAGAACAISMVVDGAIPASALATIVPRRCENEGQARLTLCCDAREVRPKLLHRVQADHVAFRVIPSAISRAGRSRTCPS